MSISFEDPIVQRDLRSVVSRLQEQEWQRFSGKRILITGAHGFIGSYFVGLFNLLNRELLSNPCEIFAVDVGIRDDLSADVCLQIAHNVTESWDSLPDFDFLIYAAGIASPIVYRKYPFETVDVTVIGLRFALEKALSTSLDSAVFFSTSEIYGDPPAEQIPTPETYRGNVACMGPRACYDESKRLGETLSYLYAKEHNVPIKVIRPFNVFGPGMSPEDGRVLPDFIKCTLEDRSIQLFSDGTPTRTFCYIEDALLGFCKVLLSEQAGEAYNIGADTNEISMLDLAHLVVKVSGKSLDVSHEVHSDANYLVDNPQRRCPDLTKSGDVLSYSSEVSLEEGVKRYYDYYANKRA